MEMTIIQKIAIWAIPLIFAITLHEVSHGYIASFFGDQTARLSGRLSLNPIKHIDLIGTIIVPLLMLTVSNFIFGWAKPVPVDPRNFAHPKREMAIVAFAGPFSNLVMAFFWGLIAKAGLMAETLGYGWAGVPLALMGEAGIMINLVLGILNLIPLPPLDGGKILAGFLPRRAAYYFSFLEPYGFIILILLMITGILGNMIVPIVFFFAQLISALFGLA